MRYAVLVVALVVACGRGQRGALMPPADITVATMQFGRQLEAAVTRNDARAVGALFAADAVIVVVGEDGETRGREAIEAAVTRLVLRYPGARVAVGRIWTDSSAAVIELVVGSDQIGVAAAAVLAFDHGGQITSLRAYVDVPTVVAQRDPSRLPARLKFRAVMRTPVEGTAVTTRGSRDELANLTLTNQIWDRLAAHDAVGTLASAAEHYRYEDLAAPRALDRAATQDMVAGFLGAVQGFTIAAKPMQLAAGDVVITELVEHMTFEGRPVILHALDIKRFEAGQVVHEWQYSNGAEVLIQLLGIPRAMLTP